MYYLGLCSCSFWGSTRILARTAISYFCGSTRFLASTAISYSFQTHGIHRDRNFASIFLIGTTLPTGNYRHRVPVVWWFPKLSRTTGNTDIPAPSPICTRTPAVSHSLTPGPGCSGLSLRQHVPTVNDSQSVCVLGAWRSGQLRDWHGARRTTCHRQTPGWRVSRQRWHSFLWCQRWYSVFPSRYWTPPTGGVGSCSAYWLPRCPRRIASQPSTGRNLPVRQGNWNSTWHGRHTADVEVGRCGSLPNATFAPCVPDTHGRGKWSSSTSC